MVDAKIRKLLVAVARELETAADVIDCDTEDDGTPIDRPESKGMRRLAARCRRAAERASE